MAALKDELVDCGPILPGTLVTVRRPLKDTGKPRRKDAGVSHMLSYNVKGRNSTMYVRSEDYAAVARMVEAYGKARDMVVEAGLRMLDSCREHGVEQALKIWKEAAEDSARGHDVALDVKRALRVLRRSRDGWKSKALKRRAEESKLKITIRDLLSSREKWRAEALDSRKAVELARTEASKLAADVASLERRIGTMGDDKKKLNAG
jgi:hypothetical protein